MTREEFKQKNGIIGKSQELNDLVDVVIQVAPSDITVLIYGESGVGKEIFAQAIHSASKRADNRLITVNCGAIPEGILESELFGHKKGTFTGAGDDKMGYFEAAQKGTIFLDEIGELPLELQGKLLRTIQYNEIMRLGDPKPINLDIRIISATNRNLLDAVNIKEFRADLYYRLNRGFIHIPALKKRGDDVLILADHFLEAGNKIYDRNILGFSEDVVNDLRTYSFPGNVRELENIILNAVAKTSNSQYIDTIDLPAALHNDKQLSIETGKLTSLEDALEEHIMYVMKMMGNSVQKTAPILGVSERTLQRRLKIIRDKAK